MDINIYGKDAELAWKVSFLLLPHGGGGNYNSSMETAGITIPEWIVKSIRNGDEWDTELVYLVKKYGGENVY